MDLDRGGKVGASVWYYLTCGLGVAVWDEVREVSADMGGVGGDMMGFSWVSGNRLERSARRGLIVPESPNM